MTGKLIAFPSMTGQLQRSVAIASQARATGVSPHTALAFTRREERRRVSGRDKGAGDVCEAIGIELARLNGE